MKIRPVGTEMFHADKRTDRQADMATLTVRFSQLCGSAQ